MKQAADPVLQTIQRLAHEEHELRAGEGRMDAGATDVERLREVELVLDQCWDLLRQRRALRRVGLDERLASPRPVPVVEAYASSSLTYTPWGYRYRDTRDGQR